MKEGKLPEGSGVRKLLAAFDAYRLFAEAPWRDDWDLCQQCMEKCMRAALAGDLAEALVFAAEVDRLTASCHAKYKL